MAAINEYLSTLQDQLFLVKKELAKFEKKNKYLYILNFIIIAIPIIIFWYWVIVINPNFLGNGGWFVVLYLSLFGFGVGLSFVDILGNFLIKNYSNFKTLKKEVLKISEKLANTNQAIFTITRIDKVQSLIKRNIDRTQLNDFKISLVNLEFKDLSRFNFNSYIEPCLKILNRIEGYPSRKRWQAFKSESRARQQYHESKSETETEPSPTKEITKSIVNKVFPIINNLSAIFASEKNIIQNRNLENVRNVGAAPKEKKDYFKLSENNIELGLQGELFVIEQEKSKLIDLKQMDLADKIEHISKNEGDHFGYDLISYDELGNKIFIEVKTTEQGINSTFYLTNNELSTLNQGENHFIYRVYNFNLENKTGLIYVINPSNGDLTKFFDLEPIVFWVRPNKI